MRKAVQIQLICEKASLRSPIERVAAQDGGEHWAGRNGGVTFM